MTHACRPTPSRDTASVAWRIGPDQVFELTRPVLMGILNVTPDSFSDGGRFDGPDPAVEHARRMIEDGAAIIDVGGESTRPGATRVAASEQIDRVIPVIEKLRKDSNIVISIDTTRADVAEAAIDAGASIINDVSAALEDDGMLSLAASRCCGLILMHRLRRPDEDSFSDRYAAPPQYEDVVGDVREFLVDRANAAITAGVARNSIVIDPGLGFGKTVAQNYELIARTRELVETGFPVLSAASRKSFIGAVAGIEDPAARDAASVAVTLHHFAAGVRLFRVHDVQMHRQAVAVTEALRHASKCCDGDENAG